MKTPERRHWCRSGVVIVNFEHVSHLFLVLLLLSLNKHMLAEIMQFDVILINVIRRSGVFIVNFEYI